mmetsp:Transcript_72114/g.150615  ORF Transcript_72114/g.150615 Transcript_72114/m.150615 type:complete len:125 (+) Transcript_72114:161-535(+)
MVLPAAQLASRTQGPYFRQDYHARQHEPKSTGKKGTLLKVQAKCGCMDRLTQKQLNWRPRSRPTKNFKSIAAACEKISTAFKVRGTFLPILVVAAAVWLWLCPSHSGFNPNVCQPMARKEMERM